MVRREGYMRGDQRKASMLRPDDPRGRNWPAILGPALSLVGVLTYFVVVFRLGALLPGVVRWAIPNWIMVVAGIMIAALGVRRAGAGRRVRAWASAVTSVVIAGSFAWILYGIPALPPGNGPALGLPAPDFALTASDGRTLRLADFRGAPLLLVFYRGHW
jgi:hypothetical protein